MYRYLRLSLHMLNTTAGQALRDSEALRSMIPDQDVRLPKALINVGTATGDRGKPATFGVITNQKVDLMQINSVSRKPAEVRKSVSLAD